MNKVSDKIKSFEINDNIFIINCEKNKLEYENRIRYSRLFEKN